MTYNIKGMEGVENFLKTHCISDLITSKSNHHNTFDYLLNNREGMPVKRDLLNAGDIIEIELEEFTSYTRQLIVTNTSFKVVQHDSFLLKLIKQ